MKDNFTKKQKNIEIKRKYFGFIFIIFNILVFSYLYKTEIQKFYVHLLKTLYHEVLILILGGIGMVGFVKAYLIMIRNKTFDKFFFYYNKNKLYTHPLIGFLQSDQFRDISNGEIYFTFGNRGKLILISEILRIEYREIKRLIFNFLRYVEISYWTHDGESYIKYFINEFRSSRGVVYSFMVRVGIPDIVIQKYKFGISKYIEFLNINISNIKKENIYFIIYDIFNSLLSLYSIMKEICIELIFGMNGELVNIEYKGIKLG